MKTMILSLFLSVFILGANVQKTEAAVGVTFAALGSPELGFAISFILGGVPTIFDYIEGERVDWFHLIYALDEKKDLALKTRIEQMLIDQVNDLTDYPATLSEISGGLAFQMRDNMDIYKGFKKGKFDIGFSRNRVDGFIDQMELTGKQEIKIKNILSKDPL